MSLLYSNLSNNTTREWEPLERVAFTSLTIQPSTSTDLCRTDNKKPRTTKNRLFKASISTRQWWTSKEELIWIFSIRKGLLKIVNINTFHNDSFLISWEPRVNSFFSYFWAQAVPVINHRRREPEIAVQ